MAHPRRWALELLTGFRTMQTELRTMVTDVRRLSDQVKELDDNTRFDIADLKASVRVAYCRPGCARHLPYSPDACAALLRGMNDSCMMSVSEIVADYVVNKRGHEYHELVGQFGGDCQAAARAAEEFFRSRKLMRSAFQECVLFSPSSAPIRFSDRVNALPPGSAPAKEGVLKRGMKAHKLIAGTCIWEPDHTMDHLVDEGAMGYNHFVVTVTALGNERVAVDWGVVEQFDFASSSPDLPCDVRLFF